VHNFKKILKILILVFLLGGPVFSQDDAGVDIDSLESDVSIPNDINREAPVYAEDEPLPGGNEEMNRELKEKGITKNDIGAMLESLRKVDPEGFRKMEAGELTPEQTNEMMKNALAKLPKKDVIKLMGGTSGILADKLKAVTTGLNSVPYESALANIRTQIDNSKAAPLFKMVPKSHEFVTHFLRDEEATSKFFGIAKDRNRLLSFAGVNIFLMFVGWRLKARRKKMNYSAGESFAKGFNQFVVFSMIKLGVLWFFFSLEIKSIWVVVQRTYS
jgi:hypothetical protein